ncbi:MULTISPECIES: DeoR/GlpR family DNA-binding transcription regulator [Actinoalloteichus]|uniref:Transcriptional regulator, DeoR family n=1 Tax=Actinoalloteichus fjordicus TaxID=1612552 RepID=A0AAC9PS94_9PSEU|nr:MULTISPECIES: DeoR/GlpR family DNA-binding transcription regulator [Actinoalloteichus]APU14903.1 transcriptional regulator, DeoR family [Actinoalloteichus fjordicus]APU20873.1 transcriptional regulator, DeoR family [Actinoalloteichus sp. GBA129-24]
MAEETPLIPDQRRELLLKHLRGQMVLSVHQLTEILGVSHMTVRRDIAALEREGRAFSVPGGVRIASQVRQEPSFVDKSMTERPQKLAMAREAARLLRDDATVYLDAGTTMLAMVPHVLEHTGMTVVTNDFSVVDALVGCTEVELIHVGGRIEHANRSSVGRLAARTLEQLSLDLAFISTSSWDLQRGVTTPSSAKVEVKRAAMAAASGSVLVAGSPKYGTYGMYRIAGLRDFDAIITDDGLAEAAAEGIRDLGIELALTAPGGE